MTTEIISIIYSKAINIINTADSHGYFEYKKNIKCIQLIPKPNDDAPLDEIEDYLNTEKTIEYNNQDIEFERFISNKITPLIDDLLLYFITNIQPDSNVMLKTRPIVDEFSKEQLMNLPITYIPIYIIAYLTNMHGKHIPYNYNQCVHYSEFLIKFQNNLKLFFDI